MFRLVISRKYLDTGGCLVRDPSNTNVIYAGGNYYNSTMGGYSMVVSKTTNGGVSWPIHSFPGTGGSYGTYCEAIAVAPGAQTTVYAGGQEDYYAKVFCSTDAGSSWRELNDGLACLDTSCIALDSDNGLLYVGTNGGSVWRLAVAPIDLNSDGIVNFEDYAVLAYNWLDECFVPDWCQGSDLNRDGIVDFGDWLDLANHWLR